MRAAGEDTGPAILAANAPADDGARWDPALGTGWQRDCLQREVGDEQYQIFRTELNGTAPVPLGPVFAGPISATEWFR
jgi:hypothetical protein